MSEEQIISINSFLIDIFKAHNIAIEKEENGWVRFPRRNDAPFYAYQTRQPKISGEVVDKMHHPNSLVVQIDILLLLNDGRLLCESFAGVGEDEKSAIENGVTNFLTSSFHVLANAFYFQKDEQIETEIWEINGKSWRVFLGNFAGRNESNKNIIQPPSEVFLTIEELIKSKNLNEDCHWFSWFYANLENKTMQCEAYLDNQIWQEATNKIENCNWSKQSEFYSFRNLVVLVSEDYYKSKSFVLDKKNRNSVSDRIVDMQLKNFVATSAELFRKHSDLEDFELVEKFVENGIPLNTARRLIEFVPIAYGQVLLKRMDVKLAEMYERVDENNKYIEREKLVNVPYYVEAYRLAQQEIEFDYNKDKFYTIAGRSAEMNAVNQLLNDGSELKDIVLTNLLLVWENDAPFDLYKTSKTEIKTKNSEILEEEKSWWQIWK